MESQKILFVLAFKLIDTVLAFIFFYLMVFFYDPYAIGKVQFAISFVAIFSFVFNLKFDVAHLKIYPETEDKAVSIGTLMFFKGLFISFSLIFYFLLLSFITLEPIVIILVLIFMFEQIIQSINTSLRHILVADNEMIKGSFPWIVSTTSKIIVLILSQFVFQRNELSLAFIYLIGTSINTISLLIYCIPYKIGKPTKVFLKKYLNLTYPLTLSTIVTFISDNIGIILIEFWISSEAVAFYYAGDHLAVFRTIIPNIITLIMISIFSKNIANNKLEKNKELIKKISKYSCILWGAVVLLSFLYSDELIILLIGDIYKPSIFVFNILILSYFIWINDIPVFAELNAKGLTKLYSSIKIIGDLYTIFLTVLFIAPNGLNLGINGVALAVLFGYATYSPIYRFILWKKYGYGFNFQIFLYLFAILVVLALNFIFPFSLNLIEYIYLIPIFIVVNLTFYFGILYLLKAIKRDDIKYFKLMLNIKALIKLLYENLAIKNKNSNKSF